MFVYTHVIHSRQYCNLLLVYVVGGLCDLNLKFTQFHRRIEEHVSKTRSVHRE